VLAPLSVKEAAMSVQSNQPPSGEELMLQRRRIGLSRYRLAGHAECSPTYIAMLEEGYRPKRGDAFARVVSTLNELEARKEVRP
jgi:predicted transcriptional regulator